MNASRLKLLCMILLAFCAPCMANVSLPMMLSDGVVLQRGMPIHVWGKAVAGESVRVQFKQQSKTTVADFL